MRIIGGRYKGKKLLSPKNDKTRPTSDRVKEAIFNIIFDKVEDAVVIDAFSGSGALGIEALSRGAKKVYFIDKDYLAAELIKRNLEDLEGDRKIIRAEAKTAFRSLAGEGVKADLIFLDPPYSAGLYEGAVKDIADNNLLDTDGLVILEKASTDKKDYSYKTPPIPSEKIRQYADLLTFLCKKGSCYGHIRPHHAGAYKADRASLAYQSQCQCRAVEKRKQKGVF
jgi:16S rRNA (guanine(966)-N(2))-methyltransferase RsmD